MQKKIFFVWKSPKKILVYFWKSDFFDKKNSGTQNMGAQTPNFFFKNFTSGAI